MTSPELSVTRDAYARAFALLGADVVRWHGAVGTLRRHGDEFSLDTALFASELDRRASGYTPESLALRLADTLGLAAPEEIVGDDVVRALPLLRPRLVTPETLAGPGRAMCRREIGPDLLVAISIGRRTIRNFVTTRMLDAWRMSFDEVLDAATEELVRRFDVRDIAPLDGLSHALAIRHEREPAASVAFGLDRLVPDIDAWPGALLGVPSDDTLVIVPLDERSDMRALGAVIEANHAMSVGRTDTLSERPLWLCEGLLRELDVALIMEGEVRRATVRTADETVARLLRTLGREADDADDAGSVE